MSMELFWLGVTSIFTLGVFSILVKDNPWYHLIEHFAIGAGTAHLLIFSVVALQSIAITPLSAGRVILVVPIVLGILQLTRITKWSWIARYPSSLLVGVGIGITLAATLQGQIISQVADIGGSIIRSTTPFEFVSFTLSGIGTICAFTYFIFTKEQKGVLRLSTKIGQLLLMAGFGVTWGCEVGWFLTSLASRTEVVIKFIYTLLGMQM